MLGLQLKEAEIVNILIKLKKSGLSESTLRGMSYHLKHLAEHCDLNNEESIKEYIANKRCNNFYKMSPKDLNRLRILSSSLNKQ